MLKANKTNSISYVASHESSYVSEFCQTPQKIIEAWRRTTADDSVLKNMEKELFQMRKTFRHQGRGLLRGYRRIRSTDKVQSTTLMREDMIRRDLMGLNPPATRL